MFQYNTIKLGNDYLTDDTTSTGVPFLSNVEGLNKFILTPITTFFTSIDGGTYSQAASSFNGADISITFDVLPVATYNSLITTIQAARTAGTSLPLFITGAAIDTAASAFRYNVICLGVEVPDKTLEAGLLGVKFTFVVTGVYNALVPLAGVYEQTGRAVTLTYSGA